jgi:hypothetical protein
VDNEPNPGKPEVSKPRISPLPKMKKSATVKRLKTHKVVDELSMFSLSFAGRRRPVPLLHLPRKQTDDTKVALRRAEMDLKLKPASKEVKRVGSA